MWLDQKLYKAVGDALAEARAGAGVKQVDLARRLRKPQSFISSYESGQRRVDVLELARICEELGRTRGACSPMSWRGNRS